MDEGLRFKDIPGLPRLFLDFVYNFRAVEKFYSSCNANVGDLRAYVQTAYGDSLRQHVLRRSYLRKELADILIEQSARFNLGRPTLNNIERLRGESAVAVVTGQQVGLFTGPLLTIYKALTAVKLADSLSSHGINAVPIFWMASDDHDLAEIAKTYLVDSDGKVTAIEYPKDEPPERRPVGELRLTDAIGQAVRRLEQVLPKTEFSGWILEAISESYRAGETFASAFAHLLGRMLGGYGLIMIDPSDARLKPLLRDTFARALCGARAINLIISERNRELEAEGYHLQVKPQPNHTLVFCSIDGQRMPLQMRGDKFLLADVELRCEELLEKLDSAPDRFTPNVLLRPIAQDSLLPTVAYIGGPSEICYYAQAQPLYKHFNLAEPVIIPRASFTVLERRTRKVIAKYNLSVKDFLADFDAVFKKAVEMKLAGDAAKLFDEVEAAVGAELEKLRGMLAEIDPTLIGALGNAREKMFYQLGKLRTKFVHAYARHNETARRQIERSWNLICPNRTMQERALNVCYFLARYGASFIDIIYDAIDLSSCEHKIVELS